MQLKTLLQSFSICFSLVIKKQCLSSTSARVSTHCLKLMMFENEQLNVEHITLLATKPITYTLTLCRLTQLVWYSAGMTMTLLCQMAVMQCNIQPGVQPVSTSWEDFAAYHLTQVTHAPSLSQSTMYVCFVCC